MPANPDFKDLFSIFFEEHVEYLVVGAHAVIFHAEPRFTKDIDLWVNPTITNAHRVWRALEKFGAPLETLCVEDFTKEDLVYQIGIAPNRIDILMGVGGVDFDAAWKNRVESTYSGVPINILGKAELIESKKITARPQDMLDVERLED